MMVNHKQEAKIIFVHMIQETHAEYLDWYQTGNNQSKQNTNKSKHRYYQLKLKHKPAHTDKGNTDTVKITHTHTQITIWSGCPGPFCLSFQEFHSSAFSSPSWLEMLCPTRERGRRDWRRKQQKTSHGERERLRLTGSLRCLSHCSVQRKASNSQLMIAIH